MQITSISRSGRMNSIEDYRKNFNNIKEFLDSPQEFSLDQKRKLYKHFFEGERKNFTISNLAKWEMYRINPQKYPSLFKEHLNELCSELNTIQNLRSKTIQRKQELYPETTHIRETLAQEGRVTLGKVQPKLRGLQKLLLKIKIFF